VSNFEEDSTDDIYRESIDPQPVTKKKENKPSKKKVIQFKDDERQLFEQVSNELNIDNKNHSDLKSPPEEVPDPSQEEIIDLLKDKNIKTTVVEQGDVPPIRNVLDDTDQIGMVTDDEIRKIKDDNDRERKNMTMLLGTKDSMNLDIKVGMKDGKSVFMQKKYYFNSISKREEMQLGMKRARLNQINTEYQVLARKSYSDLTDEEAEFVGLAPAMIEIGSYQLSEFEAKLRLGMSAEDFARVDVIQYGFALQVIGWRTMNPRFSRQGR
jgi:hypothetical protein